jgi:hypothetical protein
VVQADAHGRAEIGVSDVWLAKTCQSADIPVPERGYWARKQANRPIAIRPLPPRFPGASDEIEVGGGGRTYWGGVSREEILSQPIPPVPTFAEDMSDVEARVRMMVGKVACPRQITQPHKLISPLLERDSKRREEYARYPHSLYAPQYDGPMERRRLRIWNAIFSAFEGIGCKVSMSTSQYADNHEVTVQVGDTSVPFNLEPIKSKSRGTSDATDNNRLGLALGSHRSRDAGEKAWEDDDKQTLENKLTEIVVEIMVTAERWYREGRVRQHEWRIQRKAEVETEIRREKAEAEQKARELRVKQEGANRTPYGRSACVGPIEYDSGLCLGRSKPGFGAPGSRHRTRALDNLGIGRGQPDRPGNERHRASRRNGPG